MTKQPTICKEMTMTTTTMTLNDYINDREKVVLFWAGGCIPLGHPDMDFADRRGLLGLSGIVLTWDGKGYWRWDGNGKPTDDRANSITKLHAYVDESKWNTLVQDYESGTPKAAAIGQE